MAQGYLSRQGPHTNRREVSGMSTALWLALVLPALAAPDPTPRGPGREVLPLYRPWEGAPKVFVEVALPDGSPGLFLVDTGSDVSAVSEALSQRLQLAVTEQGVSFRGLAHESVVDLARLDWVRLGAVTVPDVEVAIDVPGQLERYGEMPIDGILGNNVWSRFVVELDLRADLLVLSRPGSVHLGRKAAPLIHDGAHVQTPVQLVPASAPLQPVSGLLMVDTGASGVLLRGRGFRVAAVTSEGAEPMVGLAGPAHLPLASHLVATRRFPVSEVRVGGARLPVELDVRWLDDAALPEAQGGLDARGILGLEVFQDRRLRLDVAGSAMRVLPSHRRPAFRDGHLLVLDRLAGDASPEGHLARARVLQHLGRTEAFEAELAPLLTDRPGAHTRAELQARVLLARAARAAGHTDRAVALLTPLTAAELLAGRQLVPHVNALILLGRLPEATSLVEHAAAHVAGHPDVDAVQADLALASGRPLDAQDWLRVAASGTGHSDTWSMRRARVALALGDRNGALAILRAAARANPLDGRALWLYARLCERADEPTLRADVDHVRTLLQPALRPLDFLVGVYAMLGDEAAVKDTKAEGLARDCVGSPANIDNCVAWYEVLAGGDLQLALDLVERSIATEGPTRANLDTKAVIHAARGEHALAAAAALAAAGRAPEDPYLLWQASTLGEATP